MKKRQNFRYRRLEHIIDKLVPYAVFVLLILIIIDLFYQDFYQHYAVYAHTIDWIIISIFVLDLLFKYRRTRNLKNFLKKYWLEIIAVFPFYLVIRIFEEAILAFRLSESFGEGQRVLHEGVEIERLAREEKLARSRMISRIFRPFQRVPRVLESAKFFEKPRKN